MNGGRDRGRSHFSTFRNARGDLRVSVSMSIDTANAIGSGSPEAIDKLTEGIGEAALKGTPTDDHGDEHNGR